MKALTISLVAGAALLAGASPAGAAGGKCLELQGTDLAAARSYVVVDRAYSDPAAPDGSSRELVGCALPDGRIRVIVDERAPGADGWRLLSIRGRFVLYETRTKATPPAVGGATVARFDLRSPLRTPARAIAGHSCRAEGCGEVLGGEVSASGRAIASVADPGGRVTITGDDGLTSWPLDEGVADQFPASALQASGRLVSWRRGSIERRALLPRLPRCKLRGRIAGNPQVRTGTRTAPDEDDAQDLVACTHPYGKVRYLGTSGSYGLGSQTASIIASAGRWLMVSGSAGNQYGSSAGVGIVDLRTGGQTKVMSWACGISDANCPADGLEAWGLAPFGRAVAALSRSGQVTIAGYTAVGERRDLETAPSGEIAPASVGIDGATVAWARNGIGRHAVLD